MDTKRFVLKIHELEMRDLQEGLEDAENE